MKKKIVFASVDFFKSTLAFILITYPLYCYIKSQFILKLENDWFLGVIIWIFLILTGFVYLFSFVIKIIFFRNEIFISKRYVKFINYYVFFCFFVFIFFTNYKCNLEEDKVNGVWYVSNINIFIYYIKWMWVNEK